MKKCPNCNIEYDDSQNFCSACSAALVDATPVVVETVEEEPKKPIITVIMAFAAKVSAILSAMFAFCSVASPFLSVSLNYSSYSYKYYVNSSFHPEEACAVFAFLFAMATVGFTVVGFIMTMIKKPKFEKLLASITKLVGATALFIASIVLLVNI